MPTSSQAPRIYNLHPLLAGPIESWGRHLERVRGMGFDRVYVNAFFAPGGSGSIYAVSDPFELHPAVRGGSARPAEELIAGFVDEARQQGLAVMTDLILPHAAQDGRLVAEHPAWFRRGPDGEPAHPVLANAQDLHHPRYMADLAELDLHDPATRAAQLDHFLGLAGHFLELGIGGFRCSAAYKVPPGLWRTLIGRLKERHPGAVFLAAALGCPFEQTLALGGCGFDLIFDSSRWWNLHDPWFLDQYEALRRVAPTVSFPEDHNTGRLAAELPGAAPEALARLYRARYLTALGLGSGVLMPMGFEYGCRRPLDPVHSSPADWDEETRTPQIDLTGFIAAANRTKAATPVLGQPGPQRRVTAPNGRIVGVLRLDAGSPMAAATASLLLVNGDAAQSDGVEPGGLLTAMGGRFAAMEDVTPAVEPIAFTPEEPLTLEPLGVRIFTSRAVVPRGRARNDAAARAGEKRLMELAANRVAIEKVTPELDGGRFPVKRIVGDMLTVEADIFADGHDKLAARVRYRARDEREWREAPMRFVDNDRWAGHFPLTRNTRYLYTVEAWRDLFASWRIELAKKHDAGVPITLELGEGLALVKRTAEQAQGEDKAALDALVAELEPRREDEGFLIARLLGEEVRRLMARAGVRTDHSRYGRELEVVVDRTAAAFAAWYELFPRSQSDDPARHGTFDDVIRKLPYVRDMGFDVLYFPPIHPIGRKNRKGRNNSLRAQPGDPGSPYAIGAEEGGHDALHPELGSFDDFARLVAAAHDHGLEIAIDFAIQCSPDHPWIEEHPEWFDWRADGSIRYAENPPKKYEDIVNVSFYREGALPGLWLALRDVVLFWIAHGVKIFRVDNPHTKPLPFWEWMIREVQDRHPEAVFLSEAFTRPKMMKRLAKVGFTQSYSYFTWRNEKAELVEYMTELTQDEPREHMRPNFFVNTPDINPVFLQTSGPAGFQIRATLAATLSTLWGVYSGFELCEATPVPGKEDYLDSEKYEIKAWDWERPGNIRGFITALNRIRRENPALWQFADLEFQQAWDENVLVYTKMTRSMDNAVLVAVNLDPHRVHGCNFEIPLWRFGLEDDATIEMEDLLRGSRFTWTGKIQHVWLDPRHQPCAIWRFVPPGLPG
ncbi:maltotransferase domain-containing protein [Geminicoccaceae bacterium 1502E]|nr:maltotransferase domain-containing protein [Geminicoccaceae bacterium 1502E]